MSGSYTPAPGGPFSALTPSMWPQDILAKYCQKERDSESDPQYDEFGFRIDSEDGVEQREWHRGESGPQREDPQQRLRWQAHLEFTHNHTVGDLTWDQISPSLARSDRLRSLVLGGIPHSMRPQLWMRLSGALQKKRTSEISYREIIKNSSNDDTTAAKQIEKDLLRTMPTNTCFSTLTSVGVPRLRRVLRGLAWLYPDIGYCQGTGMVVSCLLLFLEEEDALWMMCALIEDLLPPSYFSSTLLGVQTDQRVLRQLIVQYLPRLDRLLQEHDIELSLITLHWFLTSFASVVDIRVLLRIWDLLFYDGSIVLFQVTLGMLKIKEEELVSSENSASIFNTLSDLPCQLTDGAAVLGEAVRLAGSLSRDSLDGQRHKHLAYILAEQTQLNSNNSHSLTTNLNKVVRRQSLRRKSTLSSLLFGEDEAEALKAKNIKQTELVAALREAIARTADHFHCLDPRHCATDLTPDYSMESHQRDHDNFLVVSRNRRRRAKALLDFERHDDDELGFRKNDIINIVSQKDEHCWVGELNGLRGWFPAKFVEILDERSKEYSLAGDDSVTEAVTDLVRGTLCPALKAIFQHGLKKPSILGGACHPWLFIEEKLYESIKNEPFKIPVDDGNDLTHTFFNPDREGWLLKEGGRVKTWKRRWFILTDSCLYYFQYTTDKEPKGIIPLENLCVKEVADPHKQFCLELFNPHCKGQKIKACKTDPDGRVVMGKHQSYRISATSAEERSNWVESIRACITKDPFYDLVLARKKKLISISASEPHV